MSEAGPGRSRSDPAAYAERVMAVQRRGMLDAVLASLGIAGSWFLVGFLSLLAGLVLGLIVASIAAGLGHELPPEQVMMPSMMLTVMAALAVFPYLSSRAVYGMFPSKRLVVWLRRFHQQELAAFPFSDLLRKVCRGVAVPITLQDSTVEASPETAARSRLSVLLSFATGLAFFWGAWLSLMTRSPLPFLGFAVLSLLGRYASRRLGVLRTASRGDAGQLEELLRKLDADEDVSASLTVISCPDDEWQARVLDFVRRADAVIIDVTRLSENMRWELETARRELAPEQLVLACGSPELPAELSQSLGDDYVARCPRFSYSLPRLTWWRRIFRGNARGDLLYLPTRESKRRTRELLIALGTAFERSGSLETEAVAPLGSRLSSLRALGILHLALGGWGVFALLFWVLALFDDGSGSGAAGGSGGVVEVLLGLRQLAPLLHLAAGVAALRAWRRSRTLLGISALVALIALPIGTAIGAWTLIALRRSPSHEPPVASATR